MYVYTCIATVHTWKSEDNLQQSVLSFFHVGLWDQTSASGLAASVFTQWAISLATESSFKEMFCFTMWALARARVGGMWGSITELDTLLAHKNENVKSLYSHFANGFQPERGKEKTCECVVFLIPERPWSDNTSCWWYEGIITATAP